METTADKKNTKTPKPEVIEADLYFNSLLKAQQENTNAVPFPVMKFVSLGFLVIVIGLGLFFAVSYYVNSSNLAVTDTTSNNAPSDSGAYFNPGYYANTQRKITGRISRNSNNTVDESMQFELLANDGTNIAYIYSTTNDLNLSVGLTVEIQGELRNSTANGKEIIEVISIKLK